MKNLDEKFSITILGSAGGVAKAVLAILNQSVQDSNDPIYHIIRNSSLHLIDMKQKSPNDYNELFPNLMNKINLYQLDLNDTKQFRDHLKKSKSKIVIDVSWADTAEVLNCCNDLGVLYINSALENTRVDKDKSLFGFPLTERYLRFEDIRGNFSKTKAIIASGMNPGVVQWMAIELMKENPNNKPVACYIVEHDTSFFADKTIIETNTIYTSWSVECFLDEAILSYPMFVSHNIPYYMYEDVYASEYEVRLGNKQFNGCLMPHEEVLTLGKLFDMEIGFIYRVNEHTTELIRRNLDNLNDLWNWKQKTIDPSDGDVDGEDLVGVLLVYNDHEKYIYNSMKNSEIFPQYKTNATYFQVACGIYAGLASLLLDDLPLGIYYVDELLLKTNTQYGEYLACHMKDFVIGENNNSDGFLHHRIKRID